MIDSNVICVMDLSSYHSTPQMTANSHWGGRSESDRASSQCVLCLVSLVF